MNSELHTVWRDSRIYGLGSLLNRFAGLLLIPVVLHSVPAEEWGIYVLVLAVTGFIAVPTVAVIDTMVRLYFENDDDARRRRVVSSIMALFVVMALVFAAAAVPLASLLGTLILGHQGYHSVFLIGLLAMIADLLMGVVLDYLRIQKWPFVFVVVTLLRSLGQFALTLLLVVGFDLGVLGVVIGNLAAAAAVALPMALFILVRVGWSPDRSIIREILVLGLPLIPAWLSKSAAPLLERQVLNVLSGSASVGIFALGARLSEQLGVLMQGPFSDVWGVRLMEIGQDATKAKAFNRVFLYFLIALTTAALGLALYAPEVVRLLSAPDYWAAATVVPILALAQIGGAINYHFEVCLLQVKRTRSLAVINGSGLLLAGGLLYALITSYGIMGRGCRGAAGATLPSRRLGLVHGALLQLRHTVSLASVRPIAEPCARHLFAGDRARRTGGGASAIRAQGGPLRGFPGGGLRQSRAQRGGTLGDP